MLYRVFAGHESGHVVMYRRFGVESDVLFEFDDLGELAGARVIGFGTLGRLQDACVGWGGIMAEYLSGFILHDVHGVPDLTVRTFEAWAALVWPTVNDFDKRLILLSGDSVKAGRLAIAALASPFGGNLLFEQTQRLVKLIQQEHAAAMKAAGRAYLPAALQLARKIFPVLEEV